MYLAWLRMCSIAQGAGWFSLASELRMCGRPPFERLPFLINCRAFLRDADQRVEPLRPGKKQNSSRR